jgi:chorismate mutase
MAKKEEKKEYTEQEASELMTEIKTGRRVFETDKGLVQIRFPKVDENRLADWEYSKVFNQAIKDSIPTNKQMTKQIQELELWTKEDDDKIEKLREEIDKQIVIMGKMSEGSKNMEKAQEKIAELRNELIAFQQERQRYFQQTAESKAEEAKMSFLIYKCTEDANTGKPFWHSYDAFKNEEDQGTVNSIAYQFITFINGLPSDFLQQAPAKTDEESDGEVVE